MISSPLAGTECTEVSYKLDEGSCKVIVGVLDNKYNILRISIDRTESSAEEPDIAGWGIILESKGEKRTVSQDFVVEPGTQTTFNLDVSRATIDELKGNVTGLSVFPKIVLGESQIECAETARRIERLRSCFVKEVTEGLVSHWRFDKGSGGTAFDSVGGNDGTLVDGPTWTTTGVRNGALRFGATDNYVTTGTTGFNGAEGTISVWIKPDPSTSQTMIIDVANTGATGLAILKGTDNTLTFQWGDGTVIGRVDPTLVLTPNTWYHLAATWTNVGAPKDIKGRFYINGVFEGGDTESPAIVYTGTSYIGAHRTLSSLRFFEGIIDEVRIYDRALSEEEINNLIKGISK